MYYVTVIGGTDSLRVVLEQTKGLVVEYVGADWAESSTVGLTDPYVDAVLVDCALPSEAQLTKTLRRKALQAERRPGRTAALAEWLAVCTLLGAPLWYLGPDSAAAQGLDWTGNTGGVLRLEWDGLPAFCEGLTHSNPDSIARL